jgi:hypothetical protein
LQRPLQAAGHRFCTDDEGVVNKLPIMLLLAIPAIALAEDDGNELLGFMQLIQGLRTAGEVTGA